MEAFRGWVAIPGLLDVPPLALSYINLLEVENARLHELYDVGCDHCMTKHEPPVCQSQHDMDATDFL